MNRPTEREITTPSEPANTPSPEVVLTVAQRTEWKQKILHAFFQSFEYFNHNVLPNTEKSREIEPRVVSNILKLDDPDSTESKMREIWTYPWENNQLNDFFPTYLREKFFNYHPDVVFGKRNRVNGLVLVCLRKGHTSLLSFIHRGPKSSLRFLTAWYNSGRIDQV